jgi:hypothetical protein
MLYQCSCETQKMQLIPVEAKEIDVYRNGTSAAVCMNRYTFSLLQQNPIELYLGIQKGSILKAVTIVTQFLVVIIVNA